MGPRGLTARAVRIAAKHLHTAQVCVDRLHELGALQRLASRAASADEGGARLMGIRRIAPSPHKRRRGFPITQAARAVILYIVPSADLRKNVISLLKPATRHGSAQERIGYGERQRAVPWRMANTLPGIGAARALTAMSMTAAMAKTGRRGSSAV